MRAFLQTRPRYHTVGESKCGGCKSESRMAVGCPFITCAVKKKEIEFCWNCWENGTCEKWKKHREFGRQHDSFVCYQKFEDNISFIQKKGADEFEKLQKIREKLLKEMLQEIYLKVEKIGRFIAGMEVQIKECDSMVPLTRRTAGGVMLPLKGC